MPSRYLRWDDPNFVHTDVIGEPCEVDCITLVDDYGSLSATSMTWPREVWESLAEHILWERDRRREEAEKQPKLWFVYKTDGGGWHASLASDQSGPPFARFLDDSSLDRMWIHAESDRDACAKAFEADQSYNVWAREYLSRD